MLVECVKRIGQRRAIRQTREYIRWLRFALTGAAEEGRDMAEVLFLPLPGWVASLAVMPAEFQRSVSHLYPELERASLGAPLFRPR